MVTTQTNSVQIENLSPEIQKLREGYVDQENQFFLILKTVKKLPSFKNHPQSISPTLSGTKFNEIEKIAIIEAFDKANDNIS